MRIAAVLALLVLPWVWAPAAACLGLLAEDAWIREAPPGATSTAGYARLRNAGEQALRIDGATAPAFASAALHRTVIEKGVSRMRHGEALEIAAGASASLEPGGWHLMLMRPSQPLQAGDRVPLALKCGAETAEFMFVVKALSE